MPPPDAVDREPYGAGRSAPPSTSPPPTPWDVSSERPSAPNTVVTDATLDVAAFQEGVRMKKNEAHRHGASLVGDAEVHEAAAVAAVDVQARKAAAWRNITMALGVTEADARQLGRQEGAGSLSKLAFLLVILGCELDLYGFLMAAPVYWALGVMTVKVLLIVGPCGYLVAVLLYMCYNKSEPAAENRKDNARPANVRPAQNPFLTNADGTVAPQSLREATGASTQREPIDLKYYHFLPVVRYYLVIKDQVPCDVDGVFRVNSLSSFTLGSAQICGILFQRLSGAPMDIFVKINIGSQCINWLITLVYFGFPAVTGHMKAAVKVDALTYNSNQQLKREFEAYMEVQNEYNQRPSEALKQQLKMFHQAVTGEISEYCKMPVDLTDFSMVETYDVRRLVRKKMMQTYANII